MAWSSSELRLRLAPLNRFKPSSKYFTDRSKAVLLMWIFYVFFLSCVCYVFVRVCLIVLCGHLLGKGWPLDSRLWCLTVSLSLSHWYPGSGVVLDCIDSWSLYPYLLCNHFRGKLFKSTRLRYKHEGLTTLRFKVVARELRPLYTYIKVSYNETDIMKVSVVWCL